MKKNLFTITLILTTFFFACSKKENVEPQPSIQNVDTTTMSNKRITGCSIENDLTKLLIAGTNACPKKWNIVYLDAATNTRLNVPGLISPTTPNTFYWKPNNRVLEYSYLDPLEQGIPMDTGVYHIQDCGKTSLINTNLSGGDNPFKFEIVTPIFWQGTFYIPAGPNGSLVQVRIKGYLTK